ncbi:MAG: YgcG family protein [Myxococcota bacterium]
MTHMMMVRTLAVALLVLLSATTASARRFSLAEVSNPQADHSGWVTDHADILSPAAEARLEAQFQALKDDLGAEVVVVTVPDVDASTPREFITNLFNRWRIGDKTANNGFLVLMVVDQRRIEMETGYGLEGVLTDTWLGRVRTNHMVPAFKAGDYGAGIEAGMTAIDERMRAYPTEVREGTRQEIRVVGGVEDTTGLSETTLAVAGGGLMGVTILGIGGGALFIRRRRRRCDTCKTQMRLLYEDEEDEHLNADQELEEAIGSREWSVYVCETCPETRTFHSNKWLSGYRDCHACGVRSLSTTRTVIKQPTTSWSGLARINVRCANCDYHDVFTRVIPRESSSSSSGWGGGGGGGGGGSFGGGSAGGGGGGSSW